MREGKERRGDREHTHLHLIYIYTYTRTRTRTRTVYRDERTARHKFF
jgi:hypothetical protein